VTIEKGKRLSLGKDMKRLSAENIFCHNSYLLSELIPFAFKQKPIKQPWMTKISPPLSLTMDLECAKVCTGKMDDTIFDLLSFIDTVVFIGTPKVSSEMTFMEFYSQCRHIFVNGQHANMQMLPHSNCFIILSWFCWR
jgi:hypothetical protein